MKSQPLKQGGVERISPAYITPGLIRVTCRRVCTKKSLPQENPGEGSSHHSFVPLAGNINRRRSLSDPCGAASTPTPTQPSAQQKHTSNSCRQCRDMSPDPPPQNSASPPPLVKHTSHSSECWAQKHKGSSSFNTPIGWCNSAQNTPSAVSPILHKKSNARQNPGERCTRGERPEQFNAWQQAHVGRTESSTPTARLIPKRAVGYTR